MLGEKQEQLKTVKHNSAVLAQYFDALLDEQWLHRLPPQLLDMPARNFCTLMPGHPAFDLPLKMVEISSSDALNREKPVRRLVALQRHQDH